MTTYTQEPIDRGIGDDTSLERPRTIERRELLLVSAALLALLLLPLLVPGLRVLFVKPLWLDELHTWLLSRDPPGPSLVDRLARGADFNTPLLYVVDWMMLRLLPSLPEQVVLRLTSVLSIWLAVVLTYRMIRERLDVLPAAIGATAVLSHSILLGQLHEARFYAPWFALTIGVAMSMQSVTEHRGSASRLLVLTLLVAATCMIHYFGVLSLACLALGYIVKVRSPSRAMPMAIGMAIGMLSLVVWRPVYMAQRQVLTAATWAAAPTALSSAVFVARFLAWVPYVGVIAAAVFFARHDIRRLFAAFRRASIAQSAAIGLAAMPFVVVLVSYVVLPTLIGRYALPAVAGMACVTAIASALLPRGLQKLALAGMTATYLAVLGWKAQAASRFRAQVFSGVEAVNQVASDPRAVLSLDRTALYPTALSAANRNSRLTYLVMPRDTIVEQLRARNNKPLTDIMIIEQDGTMAHNRIFGFPNVMTLDAMRRTPSFFFLMADDPSGSPLPAVFSGFRPCRANNRLLLFEASPGTPVTGETIRNSVSCPSGSVRRTASARSGIEMSR